MDQITVNCPGGHRVRGSQALRGRMVQCPKCAASFKFDVPDKKEVTDTGIMRILGDVPMTSVPPPRSLSAETDRPCPRCERQISLTTTVCKHCSCYVGMALNAQPFNTSGPSAAH